MKLSWQQIPSTVITEILCQTNIEGVVIDTEHGCFNPETLYNCIQITTLNKKKCFVRLISANKKMIRRCLDAGCDGLIFSMIENESQLKNVSEYARYPKFGGSRGLGLVRENRWGLTDELIKEPPVLVAQIETVQGANNLENILSENLFDYIMIGPYDLSASLGVPGKFDDKKYLSCVDDIASKVSREKMAVHIPNNIENELKKYENYGIIALGMDTTFILEKYLEIEKYA